MVKKVIRSSFQILLLQCTFTFTIYAQTKDYYSLNIGDPAPPLRIQEWIKGASVQRFEKGTIYVIEFWATWCIPCREAIPHLSYLATEYKKNVVVLGIDVYEKKNTSLEKIKTFVDSMGSKMNYSVAVEDSNFIEADWIDALRERQNGIPWSLIVNADGKLAWIGHPKNLEKVLKKIVDNSWDIKEALAKRNQNKYLESLDDSLYYELIEYEGDPYKPHDFGKPDSALLKINEIIAKEPELKYAPHIAFHTFSALLKTNQHKAFDYGKKVLITSTYEEPAYYSISGPIDWYSDKLNLSAEIYELGAEAKQVEIDQFPYPEIIDIHKLYHKMAEWYWLAKDKLKAIDAEQKAIETLKGKKIFSMTDLNTYKSQLRKYYNE